MINKSYLSIALVMITSVLHAMDQASSSNSMEFTTIAKVLYQSKNLSQAERSQELLVEKLKWKARHGEASEFQDLLGLVREEDQARVKEELLQESQKSIRDYEEQLANDCRRCMTSKSGMIVSGSLNALGNTGLIAGIVIGPLTENFAGPLSLIVMSSLISVGGLISLVWGLVARRDEEALHRNQKYIQQCLGDSSAQKPYDNDAVVLDIEDVFSRSNSHGDDADLYNVRE